MAKLFWKSAAKTKLPPCPSPLLFLLIYLLFVCAKGHIQSEAAGREAVSGPPTAGPAESPGAVHPERAQEGWHTQEDDWVLSSVPLKTWRIKRSICLPEMNFCVLPVVSYLLHCFFNHFFFFSISHRHHGFMLAVGPTWCISDHLLKNISASHFIFKDWAVYFVWTAVWFQIEQFTVILQFYL